MRTIPWPGAVLVFALSGCTPGGDSGEGGDDATTRDASPIEDNLAEVAEALGRYGCEFIQHCVPTSAGAQLDRLFVDAGGDCDAWLINRQRRIVQEGLDGDEFRFDFTRFERCARESLESCWPLDRVPGCASIERGTRREGEPCDLVQHCEPGLACLPSANQRGCPFRCQPARGPGERCRYDEDCRAEEGWSSSCIGEDIERGIDGACSRYRLVSGLAEGEACGTMGDDPTALTRLRCRPGLFCDRAMPDLPLTCRPPLGLGDACSSSSLDSPPCESGLCIDGRCTEVTVRNAAGEACSTLENTYCNPAANLVCVAGACVLSDGVAGAPCDARFDVYLCQQGLYCALGTCVPVLPDGAECNEQMLDFMCQNVCLAAPDSGRLECGPRPLEAACAR